MDINKASGYDNIDNYRLHTAAEVLSPILFCFFGYSLKFGIFFIILKTGKITSCRYKAGDSKIVSNYRPISTLPCLAKVLEKIINMRLMKYLEHKKIFNRFYTD